MFERTSKEWDGRTLRTPIRPWMWTDRPESPWIPDKENVTDNGFHIGSVAEAKRKDLSNYDSRFIGQLSDITLLLYLYRNVYESSSGSNFDLWPSGKLFGQVTQFESLKMNKMHLIEKTFIRNRFEVHGRGRVVNTLTISILFSEEVSDVRTQNFRFFISQFFDLGSGWFGR